MDLFEGTGLLHAPTQISKDELAVSPLVFAGFLAVGHRHDTEYLRHFKSAELPSAALSPCQRMTE